MPAHPCPGGSLMGQGTGGCHRRRRRMQHRRGRRGMRIARGRALMTSSVPRTFLFRPTSAPLRTPTARRAAQQATNMADITPRRLTKRLAPVKTGLGHARQHHKISLAVPQVDPEKCTACGVCESVCAAGAISVDRIASINVARCVGCGQCVAECPQGALSLCSAELGS